MLFHVCRDRNHIASGVLLPADSIDKVDKVSLSRPHLFVQTTTTLEQRGTGGNKGMESDLSPRQDFIAELQNP